MSYNHCQHVNPLVLGHLPMHTGSQLSWALKERRGVGPDEGQARGLPWASVPEEEKEKCMESGWESNTILPSNKNHFSQKRSFLPYSPSPPVPAKPTRLSLALYLSWSSRGQRSG